MYIAKFHKTCKQLLFFFKIQVDTYINDQKKIKCSIYRTDTMNNNLNIENTVTVSSSTQHAQSFHLM